MYSYSYSYSYSYPYLRIVCYRSAVSIDPSLTRAVPDLFLCIYLSVSLLCRTRSCSCSSFSPSFDIRILIRILIHILIRILIHIPICLIHTEDPIQTNVLSIEWYINPNLPYRSFYCIYLSVALSCRAGSFPLSICVVLRWTISFYPSLYPVVPDLVVVSLNVPCHSDLVCVCVLLRSTVSTDPSRHSDLVSVLLLPRPSTISIDPSLNYSPFDRIYRSVSLSCRTLSVFLSLRVLLILVRVFLPPPTPTDDTPTPLSFVIVESILNLIRMHLSRGANVVIHVYPFRH